MPTTVRFSRVVDACGQPQVHTLWLKPEDDPELTRARDSHRVMTLHRARGKSEFGVIGFEKGGEENAQYLIFPKSLRRFDGARVVGVKFDLVEQPKLAPIDANVWAATPGPRSPKKKSALPAPIPFPRPERATEPQERKTTRAAPSRPAPPHARTTKRSDASASDQAATQTAAVETDTRLAREVRAALKQLKRGKTIAAYQRLERALQK